MMRAPVVVLVASLAIPARADDRVNVPPASEPMVSAAKVPANLADVLGAGFYVAGRSQHEQHAGDSPLRFEDTFYMARVDRDGLREIMREQEAGGASRAEHVAPGRLAPLRQPCPGADRARPPTTAKSLELRTWTMACRAPPHAPGLGLRRPFRLYECAL